MALTPVAGRECGECRACCVELMIDAPELRKPFGVPCTHLSAGGCAIYANRPNVCRDFHCGWRLFEVLPDDARPDRLGILIRVETNQVVLQPIGPTMAALTSDGALGVIQAFFQGGVPIFVSVPTKPGHEFARSALAGDTLRSGLEAGDKDVTRFAIRRIVRHASASTTGPASGENAGHASPG